jgi:hypothetical protein
MIIDGLVYLVYTFFSPIIGLLPDADSDAIALIHDALYNVKTYASGANWFFPVDTFFFCIGSFLGILIGIGVFKLIRWVLSIITVNLIH